MCPGLLRGSRGRDKQTERDLDGTLRSRHQSQSPPQLHTTIRHPRRRRAVSPLRSSNLSLPAAAQPLVLKQRLICRAHPPFCPPPSPLQTEPTWEFVRARGVSAVSNTRNTIQASRYTHIANGFSNSANSTTVWRRALGRRKGRT